MTAAQLATSGVTHKQLVQKIVDWGHRGGWRVYAIHDSRTQHGSTDTGFPDVFLVDELGLGRGAIAVECKTGTGRERSDQREWRVALEAAGIRSYVAYPSDGEWIRTMLLEGVPLHQQVMRDTIRKSPMKVRARKRYSRSGL